MAATYEPIATTTLGSAAASIDFTSIGSGYTDLRLILIGTSASATSIIMNFNSDTGSNYSFTNINGNGTSAASTRGTSRTYINLSYSFSASTTIPSLFVIDIFSYAGSVNKTALIANSLDYNGSGGIERMVALWRNTSAITSITLKPFSGNFNAGTTATLYGILKA